MNEPVIPRFDWGERVVNEMPLFNDGSHPQRDPEALLVEPGTVGEIVQVGMHTDTQTPVYLVEFADGLVVGCLEAELARAP